MFVNSQPGADIKLIDFGSGANKVMPNNEKHTAFAGTPFYNSPEMFQRRTISRRMSGLLVLLFTSWLLGILVKNYNVLSTYYITRFETYFIDDNTKYVGYWHSSRREES
jgi:serine/threonine protein kinase